MVQLEVIDDPATLARCRAAWEALLGRSAANQPTVSPLWLLPWWRVFGAGRRLRVVVVRDGDRVVGMAPLLRRRHRYGGLVPFRRLELLGSGEDEADEICSDYLGVIAETGREPEVAAALAGGLMDGALGGWDELVMARMDGETALPQLLSEALTARGVKAQVAAAGSARYLPLPRTWEQLLGSLGSSSRYVIKRSLRDFAAWTSGEARVLRARTAEELAEGMRVLRALHACRWQSVGEPSLFDSAPFAAFHQAVMPALLAAGALDLRWLMLRGRPLAAQYNVVWNGKVQFYQGGRAMDLPNGIRPGMVLHLDAIRSAIAEGHREYDFLPGESLMKRQLGPRARPLVELRAVRAAARELTRVALRRGRARLRGWLGSAPSQSVG
jgi:CelD/BcsL family acetyltransferase involved in cellulose biosynthesis